MQISLLKDKIICTCILPDKKKGQYWVTQRTVDGSEENVISVEGKDDAWILKSNRHAAILDSYHQTVKELMIEPLCIYNVLLRKTNERVVLFVEPVTPDRKSYRKLLLPATGKIMIGRAAQCDLQYDHPFVSNQHAQITIHSHSLSIQDHNSANGTYVNGERTHNRSLQPGDKVYIIGLHMIIGQDYIAVNNPDGLLRPKSEVFRPFIKQEIVLNEDGEESDTEIEQLLFYRSPRFKRDIECMELKIDPPPAIGNAEQTPLMLMLGPSITMGMASLFTGLFTLQNVLSTGGNIRNAMPTLVMSFSMLIGTILWPILTRKNEKKRRLEREKLRQHKYRQYLDGVSERIAAENEHQRTIMHENLVTVDDCVARIHQVERNLWERTRLQNDFLCVRLGIGHTPMQADLKFPEKRFSLEDDDLQAALYALMEQPKLLGSVPLSLTLTKDWISGIIGARKPCIQLIKHIIYQLIALHSYDELKLVIFYDTREQSEWEFVKWLPHVWNEEKTVRFVATNPNEAKELSAYLEKEVLNRESIRNDEEREELTPYYVVIAAHKEVAGRAELLSQLLKQKDNIGFSLLHLYDELKQLPKECSLVIECDGEHSRIFDKDDISGSYVPFKPDSPKEHDAHALAVKLANIQLDTSAMQFNLPKMLTFLDMFQVGKVEHLNALTRWKDNDPTISLETPIGVDRSGELFKLDLHEKFHGPHGLIAGMTGSGKSEFIMTFILSLAVNFHPYEAAFILIDYKGGGMASAFTNLPHVSGTITNLDGAAVNRSLLSIQSELKRRQSIFREINDRLSMSNIDIYKYQKLYREGQVNEPMPHLFIISDEFAELKTQQPEFMEQLVSAARIGRSLGIHLILATQKPAGVVDDQIWSNSRFRISLKVQEKADSMDVIKRPDAAELSVTGRFYVQVGFNELFELGQSAWAGAPYYPADRVERRVEQSVRFIDHTGRILKQVTVDKRKRKHSRTANQTKQIKQLDAVNQYLAGIAKDEGIKVRPLWLSPIPELIFVHALKDKYMDVHRQDGHLEPIIGEVDDPAKQSQHPFILPLTREGNAVIYGAAGSGKTTLLTTLIYSLLVEHTPDEVQFYVLDFGSETLRAFQHAPHVGDVVLAHEAEKMSHLFRMLSEEIDYRKKIFADHGGDYQSSRKSASVSLPYVVVMIHNYSAFAELYSQYEEQLSYLTREGLKYGLYFILTALNTSAVRYRMLQNFKQMYVLQLNDLADYSGVLGNVDGVYPSKYKGRGIYKSDRVYEFQIAHVHEAIEDTLEHVRAFSKQLASNWSGQIAKRIPVMPDRIDRQVLKREVRSRLDRRIPIGIEKESLNIAYLSLDQSCIHLLLSHHNDQPQHVQGIVEVLTDSGSSKPVVIDIESQFISDDAADYRYINSLKLAEATIVELFQTLVYRNNSYKDALAAGESVPHYEPITIMIYSLSALMSNLSDDGKDKLKLMFAKGDINYKFSFIIAERISYMSTISYESWFKDKVSLTEGIWIGNGVSDQFIFKIAKTTTDMYRDVGPLYGYVLNNGKATLVKLVTSSVEDKVVQLIGSSAN